jgi:hypothetical protein
MRGIHQKGMRGKSNVIEECQKSLGRVLSTEKYSNCIYSTFRLYLYVSASFQSTNKHCSID